MKDTIIVNGKELPWLMVADGFKIPSFNFQTDSTEVLGRAGSVFKSRTLQSYEFDIPLIIINEWISDRKSHDDVLNQLAVFFNYGESVKLKLKSQSWYWWAYFDGPIELNSQIGQFDEFTIKVRLLDPYKYSDALYTNKAVDDSIAVVNKGTADSYPIIKAKALKDSTSFLISKNDEDYFMLGESEKGGKGIYKQKPNLLYDHFDTNTGWRTETSGQTIVTGDASAVISGSTKLFGDSTITINDKGTRSGDGWVGPVVKKSLSRSVSDFKAFIKIMIKREKKGMGKGYMYLYNERGEVFCAIGLLDNNNSKNEVRCHVILYDEYGKYWEWVETYGKSKKQVDKYDGKYIYIEVKRKGNVWNMRTWKYMEDKKKKRVLTKLTEKKYTDVANKYGQNLAQVGVGMFSHTKYDLKRPHIALVTVDELVTNSNDVPILLNKDDEVYIDMEQALVTINETPALEEKDFGSDYFSIGQGITELFVVPEDTFETEVVWQDRFL